MVKVVRERKLMRRRDVPVELTQKRAVIDRTLDRQAFILIQARLVEIDQRQSLTSRIDVNERFVCQNCRGCNRTGNRPDLFAQIGARQVLQNLLEGEEEEGLVFLDGAADG